MSVFASTPPVADAGEEGEAPLKSWSFSSLDAFEQCPKRLWHRRVARTPGKRSSEAATRGIAVHNALENYINGDLGAVEAAAPGAVPEPDFWLPRIDALLGHHALWWRAEEEWGFDASWSPVDWRADDVWLQVKPDLVLDRCDPSLGLEIVDFKTGSGRQTLRYQKQMLLYATAARARMNVDRVTVSLWFLDKRDILTRTHDVKGLDAARNLFDERGRRLVSTRDFYAKPSASACRWCDYNEVCSDAHSPTV